MTLPLWCLLFFVVWTLLIVLVGIGAFRVASVLAGKASPRAFPGDTPHGPEWYRRVMRAHANCVENLPLFAAVVLVGHVAGVRDPTFDLLAQAYVFGRVGQTVAHVASGRSMVINVRFAFFCVQLVSLAGMIGRIVTSAG